MKIYFIKMTELCDKFSAVQWVGAEADCLNGLVWPSCLSISHIIAENTQRVNIPNTGFCRYSEYFSLSRNPVCTQEQTGSRTYMSEKTAKRNEDNRFLHFHVANFFKFMATNLSFTQFVT